LTSPHRVVRAGCWFSVDGGAGRSMAGGAGRGRAGGRAVAAGAVVPGAGGRWPSAACGRRVLQRRRPSEAAPRADEGLRLTRWVEDPGVQQLAPELAVGALHVRGRSPGGCSSRCAPSLHLHRPPWSIQPFKAVATDSGPRSGRACPGTPRATNGSAGRTDLDDAARAEPARHLDRQRPAGEPVGHGLPAPGVLGLERPQPPPLAEPGGAEPLLPALAGRLGVAAAARIASATGAPRAVATSTWRSAARRRSPRGRASSCGGIGRSSSSSSAEAGMRGGPLRRGQARRFG
jgi:hypothetical protein